MYFVHITFFVYMGRIIFALLVLQLLLVGAFGDGVADEMMPLTLLTPLLFFVYLLSSELNVREALCWKILLRCFLVSFHFVSFHFDSVFLNIPFGIQAQRTEAFPVRAETMRQTHTYTLIDCVRVDCVLV